MNVRLSLLVSSLILCLVLAVVVNVSYGISIVYTHLFYIPIILCGIWFPRYAYLVAILLGITHVICDHAISNQFSIDSLLRAAMFMVVASVTSGVVLKRNRLLEELQTLSDAMLDMIVQIDERGNIHYASRSAESITGYTREQLEGRSFYDCIHPDETGSIQEMFLNAAEKNAPFRVEYRFCRAANDDYLWMESLVNSIYDPARKSNTYVMGCRDISKRKHWEERLKESEELYRTLVECLPDIVLRLDREGRHLFVSNNISEMIDMVSSDFIGKTHRDLAFPEATCRFWDEAIRNVIDSASPLETESAFIGTKGFVIHNWRLVPERDAAGVIKSILSIGRDVTAQRKAEQDYQALFREMFDGFALHEKVCHGEGTPADYRFIAANPAFERMTELRAADIADRTLRDVFAPDEQNWIENYDVMASTGSPSFFEAYSRTLDKHFEVKAFQSSHGQFACFVADITQRKRAEKQVQASLTEKELLLKEVHHRVKNNLQVISSLLRLQSNYLTDESVGAVFNESRRRISAMATVHSLLYRSDNFAGIPFDEYIRETANQLFNAYNTKIRRVGLRINADKVMLPIDAAVPCGLIINELVSNALKHAFPAERRGQISIEIGLTNNNTVNLVIADDGVGLPADMDCQHIDTLGFKLVNMLAEQLGGSLEITRNEGTKVVLTFKI